jgi:hypothetical protein
MPFLKRLATIEVKQNVSLIARERGKIVARRDGSNIWLDLGREYLAQLISYQLLSPLTPLRNDRIRYIGVGIGGTRQIALPTANTAPLLTAYPGTNAQTDDDVTITKLERPVRVVGTSTNPPYNVSDTWLGQVAAPPAFPSSGHVKFTRVFTDTQISYSPYLVVPLSEVGLFTDAANPSVYNNPCVAYDTFETLSKTNAFQLEVQWTIRF